MRNKVDKPCGICGTTFRAEQRTQFCGSECRVTARKEKLRAHGRAYYSRNRDARLEYGRRRREDNPDAYLRYRIKRYGLSVEDYWSLLERQGGGCGICKTPDPDGPWHVDHDHACCPPLRSCGECVRGLLCRKCNLGLGCLGDSLAGARAAVEYLEGVR